MHLGVMRLALDMTGLRLLAENGRFPQRERTIVFQKPRPTGSGCLAMSNFAESWPTLLDHSVGEIERLLSHGMASTRDYIMMITSGCSMRTAETQGKQTTERASYRQPPPMPWPLRSIRPEDGVTHPIVWLAQ